MTQKELSRNGTSIFLGLIFFSSGMSKLYFEHRFPGLIGPVWLEEKLSPFDLGLFARFIAYAQVIIGFLLLTLRFSTLGALMLVPMLLNIFMITVSQHWRGTPFVIGFLLILNGLLLYSDRKRLYPLLRISVEIKENPLPRISHLMWFTGLVLCMVSIPISFSNLTFAYFIVIFGIIISFLSFYLDKKILHQIKK